MIVAGTGHRPERLGGYGQDVFQRLVDLGHAYIVNKRPTSIISGMALGWDQALAQAAIDCGVPFIAALPGQNQPSRWPEEAKARWELLLSKAASSVCLESHVTPRSLDRRNQWMVDHCDRMVALYDGGWGGTFNCLEYAKRKKKPVDNLWGLWEFPA